MSIDTGEPWELVYRAVSGLMLLSQAVRRRRLLLALYKQSLRMIKICGRSGGSGRLYVGFANLGECPMKIGDQLVMCRHKQGGEIGVSRVGYVCLPARMMIRAHDEVKAFTMDV